MPAADKPGPGKFEGNVSQAISERLYELAACGELEEEAGSVQEAGWFGLIVSAEYERDHGFAVAYIVAEDSQGFFAYEPFESEAAARAAFTAYEETI